MKVFGYTMVGVAVSFVLFSIIRAFAKGSPGTMNKEYQEATNEYLKVCLLSLFPTLSFCSLSSFASWCLEVWFATV